MMRNNMTAPPLQGISNLMKMQGRMGDTELVHMSPMEVKGLSSLGKLTRNPETGLPEAFNIGGFFRDYVAPVAIGVLSGGTLAPFTVAGYQMAKTGAMGGDFGDVAIAGLTSYAGGKLGQQLGAGLEGALSDTASGATGNAVSLASRTGPAFGGTSQPLSETVMGEAVKTGLKTPVDIATEASKNIAQTGPGFLDKVGGAIVDAIPKTPEAIGRAAGTGLGGMVSDAMLQQKLQSQAIPEQVKEAEQTQSDFSTGNLQNLNPQYADRGLTASQVVGAMQGTQAPLQFTDPSYSPAVTGNLSSILGAKDGGAMSNLKERAMGSQSKGLADALESITEGAEDIVDMGGGQVYFEGMVKGDGDGMSDEIPFSIEGQQPALLSRDEYVLPADVVAALGNGSSNAGADMLDKFMTDVREKTMGRERQINQIG